MCVCVFVRECVFGKVRDRVMNKFFFFSTDTDVAHPHHRSLIAIPNSGLPRFIGKILIEKEGREFKFKLFKGK